MLAIVTKQWDEGDGGIECVYGPFISLEAAQEWADKRNETAYPYGYHPYQLREPFPALTDETT